MTKIILAIIAFNIVMGLIAKRRQKQAENEDPAAKAKREEAIARIEADRAKREAAEARAKAERDIRDGRDDHAAEAEAASQAKKEKAKEVGKDILSQLARELGLELPQPQAPRPAPRPQPQPAPAQAQTPKQKQKPARAAESSDRRPSAARAAHDEAVRQADDRAKRRLQSEHARDENRDRESRDRESTARESSSRDGDGGPRRQRAYEDAPVGHREDAPLVGRKELGDPEALRRAFILKTILDKPVALRGRGRD